METLSAPVASTRSHIFAGLSDRGLASQAVYVAGVIQIVSFALLLFGPQLPMILISLAWVAVLSLAVLLPRRAFLLVAACVAALVLVGAVITFFIGGFLFLPIAGGAGLAVALGTSAFSESTVRRVATAAVLVGFLLLAGTIGGVCADYFSAPDEYVLNVGQAFYNDVPDHVQDLGHGIIGVGDGESDGDTVTLKFRHDLTTDQRDALRDYLLTLPGVISVTLCANKLQYACG